MTNPVLRRALAYAARGWPVFPCQPGAKTPATPHGYRDATTDEQQITAWFTGTPTGTWPSPPAPPAPTSWTSTSTATPATASAPPPGSATPGCWTAPPPGSAPPAAACTSTSPAPPSATATCPATTWTSGRPAGTSWPRPPRSAAIPTGSWPPPARPVPWTGPPSPPSCTLSASPACPSRGRARLPAATWTTWPAGSPPSPRATATPACSGPPTAPSKRTRPPT